ncbi:hypothetical protein [Nocardia arizonensis]|nr:hypothetical protein [Nocardia arizonensis]
MGRKDSDELAALIARAWQMDAARFILEVSHLGADPAEVCGELLPEPFGL